MALVAGCSTPAPMQLQFGNYQVTYGAGVTNCAYPPGALAADGGSFSFSLRGQAVDAGTLTLILDGCAPSASDCPRVGIWDGQVLRSVAAATRMLPGCGCPSTVVETLALAFLSESQASASNGVCPDNAASGGTPQPTPDGGIILPGDAPEGFDARLVCGTLAQTISPAADAGSAACESTCPPCNISYAVVGQRAIARD